MEEQPEFIGEALPVKRMVVECGCQKTRMHPVILAPALDQRWYIGECHRCGKRIAVKDGFDAKQN